MSPQENNEDTEEEQEEESEEETEDESQGESEEETEEEAPEEKKEEKKVEKPTETPEQKHARLKRQLDRHEKKHGFVPKKEPEQKADASKDLSPTDTIALINAKVHEDDIDDVLEYARFKKVSIRDALKSDVLKATLSLKEEKRTTAEATNAGKGRSTPSKPSGTSLLDKAQKTGEIPADPKELEAMLEEQYKGK